MFFIFRFVRRNSFFFVWYRQRDKPWAHLSLISRKRKHNSIERTFILIERARILTLFLRFLIYLLEWLQYSFSSFLDVFVIRFDWFVNLISFFSCTRQTILEVLFDQRILGERLLDLIFGYFFMLNLFPQGFESR